MRLPSKTTPYAKSVIAYFSRVLENTAEKDLSILELYRIVDLPEKNLTDFLSALDCLYALGKIELTEEGGLLRYAGRNSM